MLVCWRSQFGIDCEGNHCGQIAGELPRWCSRSLSLKSCLAAVFLELGDHFFVEV
jgi:hypothetical protein